MEKYFYLEIIAGAAFTGFGISYLLMVKQIRSAHAEGSSEVDNFFVLNLFKVYRSYIRIKRGGKDGLGFVFYLHIICFVAANILIYKLRQLGL
jgi:hypothetical protein